MKSDAAALETAFREIATISLNDDFVFTLAEVETLNQPHMEYPGYRVTLATSFENMKDRIQIDIGVGDPVNAVQNQFRPFEYKGKPIFSGEISLLTYPVETIFAETLETIISKGATNSRMKDYHDVILMIREPNLIDDQKLHSTVKQTFAHRGTVLKAPIAFDGGGIASLQKLWTQHLRGLGEISKRLKLPEQMSKVLNEINEWIATRLE